MKYLIQFSAEQIDMINAANENAGESNRLAVTNNRLFEITETERLTFIRTLAQYAYPACFEPDDKEELDLLVCMFHSIETDELENPGILHGFDL